LTTVEEARLLNPGDEMLAEVAATIHREQPILVLAEFPDASVEERHAKADACFHSLVENNVTEPKAYLKRHHYRVRYQLAGADSDLATALHLAPNDPQVLLTAAMAAYREGEQIRSHNGDEAKTRERFVTAQQHFQQLIDKKLLPTSPEPQLGLGNALVGLGEIDAAIGVWSQGLKRLAQPTIRIRFHARIADTLLAAQREGEMAASLDAIDALIASVGSSLKRDERLALLQAQNLRRATWHLKQRRAAAAVPLLQDLLARRTSETSNRTNAAAVWELLGRANAMLGEWGEAAVAFDRAAPLQSDNPTPRLLAAHAWLQIGRSEIAVQRAEEALAVQSSADAWLVLASAEFQQQMARSSARRSWTKLDSALQALERAPAEAIFTTPWRVEFLRAELKRIKAVDAGQTDLGRAEALTILLQAETKYADRHEFWREACLAYQRLDARDDADRAMARYQELCTSSTEIAFARSSLAVLREDYEQASNVLRDAVQHAAVLDQSRLRLGMAEVALAKRDLARARELLAAEADKRPGDVAVLRRLSELEFERGNLVELARREAELAAAGPLGQWWARYFRAARHYKSAQGPQDPKLKDALEDQARLAATRPHWPISFTLRGMIEQKMGNLEKAVAAYERAVQLGERRYSVFEQLISLLDQLNRSADAERYLARLEGDMPRSQRLTEIAGNQHYRHDRPEQALEIARQAVDARPKDALAHLWLGRLLLVTGQSAEAEQEFNRAVELAPEDVRVWNGLFSFHLRSKSTNKAREILHALEQNKSLSVADRNFVVAQGYELLGEWDRAAKEYEAAADSSPDRAPIHVRLAGIYLRSDRQRAAVSLRKALEIDPQLTIARRMLAALLASNGTEAEFHEAERLLDGVNAVSDVVAGEDRRLNAILLAQYGQPAQVDRAIKQLEELVAQAEGESQGDRVILARLYENQARSTADPKESAAKRTIARNHLLFAASVAEPEPAHIVNLIDFLFRGNEPSTGHLWLDKLESVLRSKPRDNSQLIAQFVELLVKHNAADRCEEWLNRLDKTDIDPIRGVALRARWLHARGQPTEAAKLIEGAAQPWMAGAADATERARIARAVGDIYLATEQFAQALPWYRTMVESDPSQFSRLAAALARAGYIEDAIEVCHAQSRVEAGAGPAIVLASALVESQASPEQIAQAEPILAASLSKFPKDRTLLYGVATLRAVEGNYRESIRLFRELLSHDPKHVAAINNLALTLAESPRDRDEALAVIEQAIAMVGQQPELLDTKGAILVYQGRSDQAVSLLEAAAREKGADVRHQFHLAAAYRELGETDKARFELQSALDRKLERQFLMQADRKLLADLKTALIP
jgi:tetratricopeptide (TPR) repeat protein